MNAMGQDIYTGIVAFVPNLIWALLVFLLGWVISILVSRIFAGFLKAIKLENALKTHKVEDALGTVKLSDVLTKIVKYYVLLIFVQAAVSYLPLSTITLYLSDLLVYVPVLIGSALIVLISVILGEYLKEMVIELSKSPLVRLAARGVKLVVVYIGLTMGLATAGFNTVLITGIFMTVLQALAFGVALAVGIAFGLGGQEDAREIVKSSRKQFKL
jgi:hypothetical protein